MSRYGIATVMSIALGCGALAVPTRAAAQLESAVELERDGYGDPGGGEDRRAQLRLEIEQLRREEASISQGGPVVMMVVGYVFAPLLLIGPVLLLVDGMGCDVDGSDCLDTTTPGLVMTGLGLVGAGVGIAGIIIGIENADQRRYLRGRIEDRERELDGLSLNLKLLPNGAGLSLAGAF